MELCLGANTFVGMLGRVEAKLKLLGGGGVVYFEKIHVKLSCHCHVIGTTFHAGSYHIMCLQLKKQLW